MKKFKVNWNENGWTVLQEADAKKHVVEISCFAEGGNVTEIRVRHSRGEEEKITKAIDANHSLPMAFADFKAAFEADEIKWK